MDDFSSLDPDYLDEENTKGIEDYTCCICQLIPHYNSALEETNCGHLFCSKCITDWSKKDNKCPICKAETVMRRVEEQNKIVYRILTGLIVKCQKENCNWKGPWNELGNHLIKIHNEDINKIKGNNSIIKNNIINCNNNNNQQLNGNNGYELNQLYLTKVHKHLLKYIGVSNLSWLCDGKKLKSKCYSGITDFGEAENGPRFQCIKCDYDLCLKCMDHYIIKSKQYHINETYLCYVHKHPLEFKGITPDVHWKCDATKLNTKCFSDKNDFNLSDSIPRFRCDKCDYDLCLNCFNYYSNVDKNCNIF